MTVPFRELDPVVLVRDLPDAGLRSGDLGAVVQVFGDKAVEVEFVTASGRTQALLTLSVSDVRPVRDNDLMAVRPAPPASRSGLTPLPAASIADPRRAEDASTPPQAPGRAGAERRVLTRSSTASRLRAAGGLAAMSG